MRNSQCRTITMGSLALTALAAAALTGAPTPASAGYGDFQLGVVRAPTNVRVESIDCPHVLLSWTDNSTNENGHRVYARRAGGSVWYLYRTVPPNQRGALIRIEDLATYEFKVQAFNSIDARSSTAISHWIPCGPS